MVNANSILSIHTNIILIYSSCEYDPYPWRKIDDVLICYCCLQWLKNGNNRQSKQTTTRINCSDWEGKQQQQINKTKRQWLRGQGWCGKITNTRTYHFLSHDSSDGIYCFCMHFIFLLFPWCMMDLDAFYTFSTW